MRKRLIIIPLVILALALGTLAGLNLFTAPPASTRSTSVAVTWGLLAEVVYKLTGGEVEVVQLLPAGAEIHGWEPTPEALKKVQRSRLLLYSTEKLDGWVVGLAKSAGVKAVKVGENLPFLLENHGHDHNHDHNHDHEHEHADHAWLSPANMAQIVENVAVALAQEFPEKSSEVMRNRIDYLTELRKLDNELKLLLEPYRGRLFITQHDAFQYFAKHYGLRVMAVLGAEEEEPSAARLAEVIEAIRKEGVKVVYAEEDFIHPILNTLASDTGVRILTLYTMEGLTLEDVKRGESYVSIMRKNCKALVKGFG